VNNSITNEIWLIHKQDNKIKLKKSDFYVLYHILFEVLYDIAPSLRLISDYLKTIAVLQLILLYLEFYLLDLLLS
jgi:hypothetical protein